MVIRLVTAAVGVAVALVVLFLHNTVVLPAAVAICAALMLFEYLRCNGLLRWHLSAVASIVYALALPFLQVGLAARFRLLLTISAISVVLFDYVRHKKRMPSKCAFALLTGLYVIPNALSCAVILNEAHEQHGLAYLILALGGAWIADSGAYFVGSVFGRAKLCPEISPKKTVAGFLGGIITNVVFFVVFCAIYSSIMAKKGIPMHVNWFTAVIIAMVCAVLGTLGDLAASVLKRQTGIKDFGKLMPGHGGVLDRFDSVLLVLPFFCGFVQATYFFELV